MSGAARYEWLILLLLPLGLLIAELIRTRRAIRRAREAEAGKQPP